MDIIYKAGWFEIVHCSGYWAPRKEWCEETFDFADWFMREVQYEYINHPTDNAQNVIITRTPLTWMFKKEEDAMLFTLRWSNRE